MTEHISGDSKLIGSGRTGLAVMRMQPPHRGHLSLISRMQQDCDTVIIAFGSTQRARVARHPFTYAERVAMVRAIIGDGFRPVPLTDIEERPASTDWVDHVLAKVQAAGLPEPTDFYTGSQLDGAWYVERFAQPDDPVHELAASRSYHSRTTGKRLHVIDRVLSTLPAAAALRHLIERREDGWQRYVPERLVAYIEAHYPPELRVPVADH